jgi:hypothetical protein
VTRDAETLLLILAANGGEMDKADARREWERVRQLAPDDYAAWRRRIMPLVHEHARAHREAEQ